MTIGISTSVIGRGKTGIAQYLFGLIRAFAAHPGHRFILFVLEEDESLFDFARSYVAIVRVPEKFRPALRDIFWHQFYLPPLARRLAVDVMHIPSYRRMLWTRRLALVTTIHDLAPCAVSKKYNWPRMFYARVIARHLARRQNNIIAVSRQTERDIAHYYNLGADRVACIPNGIDHGRFHPGLASRERDPFLLYVARLEHPAKNHCRLIAAFNQFKAATKSNWKLLLAGSDWQDATVIHQAAQASPFADDIQFVGFVPDENVAELYRSASVFIYPSLYEGFGFPPLEAMACGCPVIASDRGSLGEVLGGAAEIIDPENVNHMSAAISRLWVDPARRAALVAAGLRRAAEFDWASTAAATVRVYERAARKTAPVSLTLPALDRSSKLARYDH